MTGHDAAVASTDRIKMVRASCFSERQARFLVLVLKHAGVCLPRQYRRFSGLRMAGRRSASSPS